MKSESSLLHANDYYALTNSPETMASVASMLIDSIAGREPDVQIGPEHNRYLKRWWLRRDPAQGNVYLHQILRNDDDRALHDHPWDSTSIILRGTLREVLMEGARVLPAGSITYREADVAHRLEVIDGPVWSLFLTGPKTREWGFHCPKGWRHWTVFTDPTTDGETVGRGCE